MTPAVPPLRRAITAVLTVGLFAALLGQPAPERLRLVAEFNRAGLNIREGDEVRLRGFPVGRIESISTDDRSFTARYVLALDPDARVAADSGARVVPKTMFGDKYVELDPAPAGEQALGDGDVIPMDRTSQVAELEGLVDQLTVAFEAANPAQLGASISAFAAGLGDGSDLRRLSDGFTAGAEEVAARREEIQRLLRQMPSLAAAFEEGTDDFVSAAVDFGAVMQLLGEHDDQLRQMLAADAELLTRASKLVGDERFGRITADGLTLTDIVLDHPGAVRQYMAGVPVYLEGLNSAVWYDTLFAIVPHFFLGLPYVDAKGDLGDADPERDGTGIGPDVVIESPEYPDPHFDLGEGGDGGRR
jgi:virulence factor Mce-like protein